MKRGKLLLLTWVLLLSACGGPAEEVATAPPELIVVCGEEEATAWQGGSQWRWPDGDAMCSAIADAPHPLDVMDDLPVISAKAGDELVLAFGGVPDKTTVIYYRVEGKELTVFPVGELSSGSRLTLPENCGNTLWIVRGKWETGESTGQAEYAFRIS